MSIRPTRFSPKNPKKYVGDPTNIWARSSWEKRVMKFLDENPSILEWKSEEFFIPYKDPTSGKTRRYFPDFYVKIKQQDNSVKEMVLEVKPKKQSVEPTVKKKITKAYINEVMTWGINKAKWEAARNYCRKKGWEFQVLTEDQIFGPKK